MRLFQIDACFLESPIKSSADSALLRQLPECSGGAPATAGDALQMRR